MSTTTETISFRVPTPADLRAIGYSNAHSELLPLIFGELQRGWRTPSQLRLVVKRSKKTVCAALCAAAKRKHAAKRPRKKKEHLWGLGENAATIPRRMLDLLAEAELPTTADFAANGFTPRPAEYAEHVIKVLNDNEGDLPGIDLAAKVGVEWPNLGYTLRPLQTLGCVERASRHRGTRERDRIMLVASGVRRLPRVNASQHVSSRRLSRDVAKTLDTVDPAGVRNWALKRHLIETVAPRRLLTHEQLAIEMGCSPGTLYGDKKYPGPLPELKRDGVVKTHREAAGTVFEVDLLRISELYPVLPDGHRASTISRRRQRLGAKRRCWDRLDAEMRQWGEIADHKRARVRDSERLTAYFNIAARIGDKFRGTYAELSVGLDVHAVTVATSSRQGRDDGFFKITQANGRAGEKAL